MFFHQFSVLKGRFTDIVLVIAAVSLSPIFWSVTKASEWQYERNGVGSNYSRYECYGMN